MFNKKHIISLIVIINLFLVGMTQIGAITAEKTVIATNDATIRAVTANYVFDTSKPNEFKKVEIRFVYDRLGDNFVQEIWYYKDGASSLVKSSDPYPAKNSGNIADVSMLPDVLYFNKSKDEISVKKEPTPTATYPAYGGVSPQVEIHLDKSSIKTSPFKTYSCAFVNKTTNKVLKVDYNQNGKSTVYYDGKNISSSLKNLYYTTRDSVYNTIELVTQKDNASDFSGGTCPKFANYIARDDGAVGVHFSDYSNASAEHDPAFDWIFASPAKFSVFEYTTDLNPGSGSSTGKPIVATTGCGMFGSLLDDNGIIREIFDVIKYLIVIGLVVLGMVDYSKAVMAGDPDSMKKANKRFMNRIIIAILIFIMPILIDFVLTTFLGDVGDTCIKTL